MNQTDKLITTLGSDPQTTARIIADIGLNGVAKQDRLRAIIDNANAQGYRIVRTRIKYLVHWSHTKASNARAHREFM